MQTLTELKTLCEALKSADEMPFDLGLALAESDYLDYHYSFIYNDDKFSTTVWYYFKKHQQSGLEFLISKLTQETDSTIKAKISFMIGQIVDKLKNKSPGTSLSPALYETAHQLILSLCQSHAVIERENAVIVLGWIGRLKDIPLLGQLLINDDNENVRAWSASAFMQLSFRLNKRQQEQLKRKVAPYYQQSLQHEQSNFVIGVILSAIKDLYQKTLSISQRAIDDQDIIKIDKAKQSALRFLAKVND